jgi:HK97 family phage portal protein
MSWFNRKEKRESQPHKEQDTSACNEVSQGIGLLQKLLNLKGYGPLHQSAFFAALALISNSIAMMSWDLKSYNEDDEPDNHFLKDLFANSQLTQFMIIKNMIKDCLMHGNGFCYIERDKSGKPIALKYLPFGECNIIYNKMTDTLLYQIPRLKTKLVEPCNVLHIRMITNDGVQGLSIMDFANSTIKLSAASEKAAQDFFSAGMTVQGVLSTETPRLTKDQREAIRSAWNESQCGTGAGLAVLEGGMTFTPVSSNSKEGQLLESRVYNVQEIARFFNISPVLLGDLSKSSYNSVEQAMLQFVLNTLSPYITMLEQELNLKLIMPDDRYRFYIDICEEDIIRSDKNSQANYLNTLVQGGIITRNEARKKLGYPAIDGGDSLMVAYTDVDQNTIGNDNTTEEENETLDEEEKEI